jgi:hypothetical protein
MHSSYLLAKARGTAKRHGSKGVWNSRGIIRPLARDSEKTPVVKLSQGKITTRAEGTWTAHG